MQTITAVIPAKNEELNIERCLDSLLWCDKVIVLSTGTDKTAELARKKGAVVIEKTITPGDDFEALQRNINWTNETASTNWILRIDADEVVSSELEKEINEILNNPPKEVVAFGIPRKQYFLGHFLKGGDWAYDRLTRLYKPQFCRYEPIVKVHEQFKVNGKIGYIKSALIHYSHPDIATLMRKFDSYTTLEAKELKISRITALIRLCILPPYIFLRWMIYHHGYRDGWKGVQAGAMRAYYDILLYFKFLSKNYR